MKFDKIQEILKKSFGKQKDERYHAIAMLTIYGVLFLILIIFVRVSGSSMQSNTTGEDPLSTPSPTSTPIEKEDNIQEETNDEEIITNDINYSYSYTITYNGKSEVYLGKKIDDKEKFTLIKDNISTNYAIINENYLIENGDTYSITEKPSDFFKYCDMEKVLLLIKDKEESTSYLVSNSELKSQYKDKLLVDNSKTNTIKINISNDTLKSVDLDFSNYISSVEGSTSTLTIHMEFVDIGTTEDFEIKVY